MRKKRTISLLLALCMALSLAACGQQANNKAPAETTAPATIPAATPGPTAEPVALASGEEDFARAFDLGLIDESYAAREPDEQVTSREYKAMLTALITELAPEELEYFNAKVTDYDTPLTRGEAVTMSWYAAVCIGADGYNYTEFDNSRADGGDFWDQSAYPFPELFPDCYDDSEPVMADPEHGAIWDNEFTASFLWNLWHKSPVSGSQVVAFDEAAESMRNHDPFTVENAACAVARLYDSDERPRFVSVDDSAAAAVTISKAVLAKAAGTEIKTIDDLPRLTGFRIDTGFLNGTSTNFLRTITRTPQEIEMVAGWGFSSVLLFSNYQTFFSDDCTQVNLAELKKLDALIAAAIENDVHICFLMYNLPGRSAWWDENFASGGEFDMFVNPEKLAMAETIWRTFARRYKDIPGAYLSFEPVFEPSNRSLSTGKEAPEYDEYDICNGLEALIAAIREEDPDRFIIQGVAAAGDTQGIIKESTPAYEMAQKYGNMRMFYNFVEMAYVYAEMTATEGEHIDFNNHSLFKPEYPVTIYAAQKRLDGQNTMTIDGCLPAGTQLDLYLSRTEGNGTFTISSEAGTLHQERTSNRSYETSYLLSWKYPYATSDKKISITLTRDTDAITLRCENCAVEWSGMDVTLPDSYAVERWYSYTNYDAYLNGEPEAAGMSLRETSRVMISPDAHRPGLHITIHDDVTFTTETVAEQSNAETIDAWGSAISAFTPKAVVRYENASFDAGTTQASILRYYDDVLSMFDKYGFDWYSNDYELILRQTPIRLGGAATVQYGDYPEFNLELLRLLQKHQ